MSGTQGEPLPDLVGLGLLSAYVEELPLPHPMRIPILLLGHPPHFPSSEGEILQKKENT